MSQLGRLQVRVPIVAMFLFVAAVCPVSAQLSEQILTDQTKAFFSIPNVEEFEAKWNQTLIGQLAADPVMKPFAQDMRQEIRERLIQSNMNLDVNWDEIKKSCAKELSFATVLPLSGEGQAAMLIIDTSGREQHATAMLDDLGNRLKERDAKRSTVDVRGNEIVVYQLPRQRGKLKAETVAHFTFEKRLLITNHVGVAQEMLIRLVDNEFPRSLAETEAYQKTVRRCELLDEQHSTQLRWFIEPFGLVRLLKNSKLEIGSTKHDYLQMFADQGFDAVKAVGGVIHLATDKHEMLHRTFVFAPPVADAPEGEKYKLAARMLDFPNDVQWTVPNWVPRDLATYMSIRWKTAEAFEHASSLVDALAGQENYFEGFLAGLKDDENGIQLDVRQEFVAYLDDHIHVLTDQVVPVTTTSERMLVAIRLTDSQAVAKTLRKLEGDREFKLHHFGDVEIWEYLSQPEEDFTPPEAILDLDDGFDLGPAPEQPEAEPEILSNLAFTVAHNHLLISTHMNLLEEIINRTDRQPSLQTAADFQRVNRMLAEIGAGNDFCRFFARTDEEFRTNYELLRQGKMPQSESFLGRVLNRILGERNRDVLREQALDGKKLPEYQVVRRYFGPAGLFSRTEDDGWLISGILVSKHDDLPVSSAP